MTLKRLMIALLVLMLLVGGGIAWLWEYGYSPQGRARNIFAQLREEEGTTRAWMLDHGLLRREKVAVAQDESELSAAFEANAKLLAGLGPKALPAILEGLRYRDFRVYYPAADACGELKDRRAVGPLIQLLAEPSQEPDEYEVVGLRASIATALGKLGGPEAVAALTRALDDPDSSVQHGAVGALGRIGDRSAVPALLKAMEKYDGDLRGNIAQALGAIGGPEATAALIKAIDDQDSRVRRHAVAGLRQIGDPSAVPALLKAMEKYDGDLRGNIAQALGAIGDRRATQALMKLLEDDNQDAIAAADALGNIKDPQSLPALRRAAASLADPSVRVAATLALHKMGQAQCIERLLTMLKQPFENSGATLEQSREAEAALMRIGECKDPRVTKELLKYLRWEGHSKPCLLYTIRGLGQNGDSRALPALLEYADSAGEVRCVVAEALGELGDKQAIPTLRKMQNDPEEDVRDAATEALKKLGQ